MTPSPCQCLAGLLHLMTSYYGYAILFKNVTFSDHRLGFVVIEISMEVDIRNWYASYYIEVKRKWIYGTLHLKCSSLTFVEQAEKPTLSQNLVINLSDVSDLRKTTSSLIFKAITLITKSGCSHWFGSFLDRESVYSVLSYFWRNILLQNEKISGSQSCSIPTGKTTKLGSALLGMAVESERKLMTAAVKLNQQGEQIETSIDAMQDMHDDLDVANKLVSGLEKWLGNWKLPTTYVTADPVLIKDNDVPDVFDYEVLYTQMSSKQYDQQTLCVMRVAKSGITILDMKQNILFIISWHNVSLVMVVTPWELIVTQFQIGQPDFKFSIVSSALFHIVKKIERFAYKKLDFDDSVRARLHQESAIARDAGTLRHFAKNQEYFGSSSRNHDIEPTCDLDLDQQITGEQEIISDAEVNELQATLSNLKSIALAVCKEEEEQKDRLEFLTGSVERANDRIKATTDRTNRLL